MKTINCLRSGILLLLCLGCATLLAQTMTLEEYRKLQADSLNRNNRLSDRGVDLDLGLTPLTIGVSLVAKPAPGQQWTFGAGADFGGNVWNHMVFAGEHFSGKWSLSLEGKSGETGQRLIELLGFNVFARKQVSYVFQLDLGIRYSYFLHYYSSFHDAGRGRFYGAYMQPMFGKGWLKFGPRIILGRFDEWNHKEIGLNISWLTFRVSI